MMANSSFFCPVAKKLISSISLQKYSFLKKGISVDRMFLSRTRVFY